MLWVRIGYEWKFKTCTCPTGNPWHQTHGYAQPMIISRYSIYNYRCGIGQSNQIYYDRPDPYTVYIPLAVQPVALLL